MHSRLTHPSSVAVVCPTTPWSANASVATAVVVVGGGSEVVGEFCFGKTAKGALDKAWTHSSLSPKGFRKSKVGITKAGCSRGIRKTEGLGETEGSEKTEALENSVPESGCPTWIRTMTNRFRDCCATITPSGSRNRSRDLTKN